MTSRPAAPESPETDALLMQHLSPRSKWLGLGRESYREAAVRQVGALIEHARSLERRLSLAQTEIKGHMRTIDDLERDLRLAIAHDRQPYPTIAAYETLCEAHRKAQARIAELEKDAARYRWLREHFRFSHDNLHELWFDENVSPHAAVTIASREELDSTIDEAALKSRA